MNWKTLVSLGLCSVGEYKREPVAYLYNGSRFPKIPTVEGYSYAVLSSFLGGMLYLCKGKPTAWSVETYDKIPQVRYYGENEDDVAVYRISDGKWVFQSYYDSMAVGEDYFVWANTDLYYREEDGGVLFRETSDPIPVYA